MRLDQRGIRSPYRIHQSRYQGVSHSVEFMRRLAYTGQSHPLVRQVAVEIIRQVIPRDYLSEMAALYYDTCRRVRYTRDPVNVEFIAHPAVILRERVEDCDGMAVLQRALLGALGLAVGNNVEFVTVGFARDAQGENRFTHVFLRVRHPQTGQWLIMDPVAGPFTKEMADRVVYHQGYPTA